MEIGGDRVRAPTSVDVSLVGLERTVLKVRSNTTAYPY